MCKRDNQVAIIGAGNVATHLAKALSAAGCEVTGVMSRTAKTAEALATQIGAKGVTDMASLPSADVYIYAVSDDALPALAERGSNMWPEALHIHTSGSTPIDVFCKECRSYGVLYPMQTFSKQTSVDFRRIPCFVEGKDAVSLARITSLAARVADSVTPLDSVRRLRLHLAAVFACNFVNHCYAVAADVIDKGAGLPASVLWPLIDETAEKVHRLQARDAQTGPAVRNDRRIMNRHLQLLEHDGLRRELYAIMSDSIHDYATRDVEYRKGKLHKEK